MNVLENKMPLYIDPVACGTKESPLAGPPEEIAAAVFIFIGKGMKKVAGDAAQLATDERKISGYGNVRHNINRMRPGLFQVGMAADTFGIKHRFKAGRIFICIQMAGVAFFARKSMRLF